MVSAGPYANLHLDPDTTTPASHHSVFLQAECPSCRPTNGVTALKAIGEGHSKLKILSQVMYYVMFLTYTLMILSSTLWNHSSEQLLYIKPQVLLWTTTCGVFTCHCQKSRDITYLYQNIQHFQTSKSRRDDEKTFKSVKFASFISVVTEVQYSTVHSYFANLAKSRNPAIISAELDLGWICKKTDFGRSWSRNLVQP